MPIRVVMIDDDADFLWLIRFSLQLEHDITVIGEADEGETEDQFLHLVPWAPPGYCRRACVRDIQQPAVRRMICKTRTVRTGHSGSQRSESYTAPRKKYSSSPYTISPTVRRGARLIPTRRQRPDRPIVREASRNRPPVTAGPDRVTLRAARARSELPGRHE
jgi:hypothetical protein